MNFNEYQNLSKRTINPDLSDRDNLINGALGCVAEGGEVADYIKKHTMQGHPLDKKSLILELGDTLFYLALIASMLDVTLQEVAEANVSKLAKRFPDGFTVSASINREVSSD